MLSRLVGYFCRAGLEPIQSSQQQLPINNQTEPKQIEQAKIDAVNRCHEEDIKAQESLNELRISKSGTEENIVSDFVDSTIKAQEQLAKASLQQCLLKAEKTAP
jgi:hypothetical protein